MFPIIKLVLTTIALAMVNNSCVGVSEENDPFEGLKEEYEIAFKYLPIDLQQDAKLLVPDLIKKYDYPIEIHTIQSKDGYILEIHRIPYGKQDLSDNRTAVYLQHGILASSADWVLPGPGKGFGYILADAGYDVWMPNVRGNRYSRKHIKLDPLKDAKEFWDFSWHEIAIDDVPTIVDYIREQTGQDKFFYIGHSQGTTLSYVMLSEKEDYNDQFKAIFSLAPIAYMGRMTSPILQVISMFSDNLEPIFNKLGMHEFLPRTDFLAKVGEKFCGDTSAFQILCINSLFAVSGFNRKQMNSTLVPVIMGHTPAGSSSKQLIHYAQGIISGKFRQWDYGSIGNLRNYGSLAPPKYKLENVKVPVYIYYSQNDWLSNTNDVDKLANELRNVQGRFLIADSRFSHVDYVYGIEAPQLVYYEILDIMEKH
ncbi:hypothetical protein ILUMI_16692 [Ignelater luminosus]|uniref:Lipase n=1 Tax=Ignelater luminosus TaxID=2038154 RepID=A0A8K0CQS8_IGNLU|nr:hypothetical protein ILUMI_16692 [Ignelater luminosus]